MAEGNTLMGWLLHKPFLLGAVLVTPACTSLGTNVSGSFRCEAPDGICAPSVAIDDRALAEIVDSEERERAAPAGRFSVDDGEPGRRTVADGGAGGDGAGAMAPTYRLNVVFPTYTDIAGAAHERRTVTAQVDLPGRTASSVELAWRPPGRDNVTGLLAAAQNAPLIVPEIENVSGPAMTPGSPDGRDPNVPAAAGPIKRIRSEVDASLGSNIRSQVRSFPPSEEDR
jgi:conjugal transfer pilus assembly protein TraV